jgi:hypothetical protein
MTVCVRPDDLGSAGTPPMFTGAATAAERHP